MFAIITPALITGAFADRVSFKSYLIFLTAWSALVYVPVTHWVWGGGFLQQLGAVDFAGGLVVHTTAGVAALMTVYFVGKRKFLPGESKSPHNITYVALGTGLLWFGWFGFNGGSALAANGIAATAFANTDIAGSIAMITWLLISWTIEKKPSLVGALTGAVAGLATITPCAGYVRPLDSAIIGFIAAIVCYSTVRIQEKINWDDALDVWACHGVGGILGSILVGVFAHSSINGVSGVIEGNWHQLWVQLIAVGVIAVYTGVVTVIILKVVNHFIPVRVQEDQEFLGLDETLHGEAAYRF
jgi:ammonium transporter, Amt family